MTRTRLYILFGSCVIVQIGLFTLLALAPSDAWYSLPLALCNGAYTGLTIAKVIGLDV